MDILTHTITGVAIGTVMASFTNKGFEKKLLIIIAGGFGACLPDIDAISLWSGFDATLGRLFALNHSGKEIYSAKFWYSHHAFFHSIFAGILIALVIIAMAYLIKIKFRNLRYTELKSYQKKHNLLLFSFVLGFILHLLQDMPTPCSTWGGVNFFWPLNSYIGGTGHIWWWNNYDIFLIVLAITIINTIMLSISNFKKHILTKITLGIFFIGFTLCIKQINTRGYKFNYTNSTSSYQEHELKSKEIQKQILGESLFNIMLTFDNKLKIYF